MQALSLLTLLQTAVASETGSAVPCTMMGSTTTSGTMRGITAAAPPLQGMDRDIQLGQAAHRAWGNC